MNKAFTPTSNSTIIQKDCDGRPLVSIQFGILNMKWIDKKAWDFDKEFMNKQFYGDYMKQKVVVFNVDMNNSVFFNSYEDAAKYLDTKVSNLKRVVNTDERIQNVYLIKTK